MTDSIGASETVCARLTQKMLHQVAMIYIATRARIT